ncbi:glycosyltransferase [Rossellomorea marisflavi]|uniref:glycosyltransferase n=1 Tax=Rossellomorea marisflavi TaxID=189381 RepID=UPI00069E4750|nr:glycosyltransferase [Rossellomorea marisflavi]
MEQIKLSFIVPVYNVEEYLVECLESLIEQPINSKEIIIVNDGSTDSSINIINEYSKKYEFVHVINQKNKGLSEARNVGLLRAKGKYVQFIDSDDFVDLNYAQKFYYLCEENELDILRGKYKRYSQKEEKYLEMKQKNNITNSVMSIRDYFNHSIENQTYEVTAILGFYNREFLLRNELFFLPNVTMEDHDFTLRCLTRDPEGRCMEVDNSFYTYRIRPMSITTTFKSKNVNDIMLIVDLMNSYVQKQNFDRDLKYNCYRAISTLIYQATSVYGRLGKTERKEIKPLFKKKLIKFAAKYSYTNHQKIKFIVCYFFWPLMDLTYRMKKLGLKKY